MLDLRTSLLKSGSEQWVSAIAADMSHLVRQSIVLTSYLVPQPKRDVAVSATFSPITSIEVITCPAESMALPC